MVELGLPTALRYSFAPHTLPCCRLSLSAAWLNHSTKNKACCKFFLKFSCRVVATMSAIINHEGKPVKTTEAIEKAGGKRALAELLGVTTQAIQGWGETVPKARQFMIRTLRPQWFGKVQK